ncbi:MAG: 1-(5-phosphoribosyl)-5-[(5-phosphoribosylamino)methylideneamino]imidazole-4-carboxamide isomerase [Candidatus Omnitrophica bacterium]|nr:1-(5-phosphoribosyl)-5-[(5-phosphoribosylamino)methylideneamino]imidazole-4-carboxamide isomerase [Candidatus Omnitrophota bacterium]
MIVIPAIDLKNGNVVRLFQGKPEEENIYSHNPATIARHWQKQGARLIHVVDLDGAFAGKLKNLEGLKDILRVAEVPIEFGGGVRDIKTVEQLLAMGVSRVVLGTRAVEDRGFLAQCLGKFRQRIIVSIDARKGKVAKSGWQEAAALGAVDFALSLKELGFRELIYTDVAKDGTLAGPNIAGIKDMIKQTGMQVVASGGVSSLEDIAGLKGTNGVIGVIVGKALYEEKFSLKEALLLAKRGSVPAGTGDVPAGDPL